MNAQLHPEKNVLGGPLLACSYAPLTGYFRDGWCACHGVEGVAHLVCVRVTREFLDFSVSRGNDLVTPQDEVRFRGLKPGDRWCLCVQRWAEALEAGMAPPVILEACQTSALEFVSLEDLQAHSVSDG